MEKKYFSSMPEKFKLLVLANLCILTRKSTFYSATENTMLEGFFLTPPAFVKFLNALIISSQRVLFK